LVNENVYVSYVESVNEFYVQRARQVKHIIKMQKMLNSKEYNPGFWGLEDDMELDYRTTSERKEKHGDLKEGVLVVVKYTQDNLLYRARVTNIYLELDSSLTEIVMAELIYIDFGNKDYLPLTSLAAMPTLMEAEPPMAIKCSLFDCMPMGEDTTTEFKELVSGHRLLLEKMSMRDTVNEVDLIREVDDSLTYTSVRDVLVLSGKAVFYSSPSTLIPNMEEKQFKQLPPMTVGSAHTVILSHLHQLSREDQLPQLSVQLLSDKSKLSLRLPGLMDQMAVVYGVKRSEELWGLGRCWPGVVCAVRDTRDKLWYRGEVVSMMKGRMVLVKYVDFGNCEVVPAHRMRRLFKDFMELPALATRVSLGVPIEANKMDLLRAEISLVDLTLRIVKEDIVPVVELQVEGMSVTKWLMALME